MFSSDRNIETISQLIVEIKRYVELRAECLQIDIVSKMSRLFTAIILFVVLFMLSALAVMFMSMTAAAALAPIVGGMATAYAIIVVVYIIIGIVILCNRKKWIEAPIAGFLTDLFLNDTDSSVDGANINNH